MLPIKPLCGRQGNEKLWPICVGTAKNHTCKLENKSCGEQFLNIQMMFVRTFGIETSVSKNNMPPFESPFQYSTNSARLDHSGRSLVLICATQDENRLQTFTCLPCWAHQPQCASARGGFHQQSFSRKCLHLPWMTILGFDRNTKFSPTFPCLWDLPPVSWTPLSPGGTLYCCSNPVWPAQQNFWRNVIVWTCWKPGNCGPELQDEDSTNLQVMGACCQ